MADCSVESVGIEKLEIPSVEDAILEVVESIESSEVPAPATASSNPDDQFDDISVFDTLNAKRSPKQDRSSKRVLRKSTIRLASTNEGLVTEATIQAEEEKIKEDQAKADKLNKKKSFKNLFGLLSFNNKSKNDETINKHLSTSSISTCDTTERSSVDGRSYSTSFSTDNPTIILNPTATDHVSNPIKRESLSSPKKVVKSETEIVLPEENKPSGGSNSISPMPNRKGTFNKIRSKSIHRVVSVRTYEQEKQQNPPSMKTELVEGEESRDCEDVAVIDAPVISVESDQPEESPEVLEEVEEATME